MADIKELDSIIQIDGNEYAVVAEKAEKLANKLTISVKQGDTDATQIAEFDGSEAKTAIISIPKVTETTLTIVNKTQSDTDDTVYAITNLAEDPNTQNGHYVTPTYTAVPTKKYVDDNKQAKLVSGTNIKTINGESLLGSGDLSIAGGAAANNGTLTIQKNGTNVATFTANSADNVTANITVPTITDSLTSTSTTAALSANQGRLLKEAISGFKNITVSQNEPTGGATGDIWFKY